MKRIQVVDEILTINIHNDKVTVDVPKTGDTFNLWLWVGLMALGAAGAGTTLFISRKA